MSTETVKTQTAKTKTTAPRPVNGQAAEVGTADRAKKIVAETMDKSRDAVEAAREKLRGVAGDVNEKLHGVSENAQRTTEEVRKRAAEAREAARQRYEVTSQQVHEGYVRARRDAADLVEDATDYVRENPGKAILIAAAAGFVVGLLFRQRDEA